MARLTTDDGCWLWTAVRGSGPRVVLVHGGPGWWDVFHGLRLPGFRLVRWDQRGCGRSERRGPYTLDRFVADLAAVCDGEPCFVIGHSWGASLALLFAQRHPELVQRLVLVSFVGFEGPPADYRARVAEILAATPDVDPWVGRIAANMANPTLALAWAEELNSPRFVPNQECADAVLAELRALPDRRGDAGRVTAPTLVVHGSADLRPPSVTDALVAVLPDVRRVVLDGVGHYPWVEDPDAFESAVREFFS